MANEFLDAQVYANTMLYLVTNQLTMGRLVDTRFENQVTDENGLSIKVKRPARFLAKDGATLQEQDVISGSEQITVDQYKNVHLSVGDLARVQSYNELLHNSNMKSAANTLAHEIDGFLLNKFKQFPSWVGTPGNNIGSPAEFNKAHTRLMNMSVMNDQLCGVVSFDDGEEIRGSLIGGNIDGVNRSALERIRIPILSEVDLYASNNLRSVTTGSRTNGTVDGGSQESNYRDVKDAAQLRQTINLAGLGAAGTITAGEVFTIDGCFAVNPRSQEVLDYLQQFTVLEDATADGTGDATVTISPAIIVTGSSDGTSTDANTAWGTVSAAPAGGATVTWLGSATTTYPLRAAFHKQAISLVTAPLERPFTGEASFAQDPDSGIAIRYWRGSDISTGKHIHRWDMIYGASVMDPMMGTRISGAA